MKKKISLFILLLTVLTINLSGQCSISNLQVSGINCYNEEDFSILINFDFDEVGDNGFTLVGNGNNYGTFLYSSLPIEIDGLGGNCITEYEFIVRDVDNPSCIASTDIGTICCGEECSISIHEFAFEPCEDGMIGGEVVFNMENFYYDSIRVNTSNNYETVLPLINNSIFLNDVPADTDIIDFTFSNPSDSECSTNLVYESTCTCNITNIDASIVDCNEEEENYYVRIDFDNNMTSDSFLLGGNSVFTGTFSYNELPLVVGPYDFSSVTDVNFLVQDSSNPFCFAGLELGIIDECPIPCHLDDLVVTPQDCNDGTISLNLTFSNSTPNDGGFTVSVGSQVFGPFEYGEDSYIIEGVTSYCLDGPNLVLRDITNDQCLIEYEITDELCCEECQFTDIVTEIYCLAESTILLYSFNHQMGGDSYYVVIYNDDGTISNEYGPYDYNYADGIDISDLPNGEYNVQFVASNNENCEGNTTIIVDCNEGECNLRDLTTQVVDCENGVFYVSLSFISSGNLGNTFTIRGNGNLYGEDFLYGEDEYLIGPLDADCEMIYEFVVIDGDNSDCSVAVDFEEPVCCGQCEGLRDINLESLGCDENEDPIGLLEFFHDFEEGQSFTVTVNGNEQGPFLFSELPVNIELATGVNTVMIVAPEECIAFTSIDIECNDCVINDLNYEVVECIEGQATIQFNGIFAVGSDIEILLNGEEEGTYESDDFPILMDNISSNDTSIISIVSSEFPNCNNEFIILPFECTTSTSDVYDHLSFYQSGENIIVDGFDGLFEYVLYGYDGRIIQHGSTQNSIDIGSRKMGVYILHIQNNDFSISRKIVLR